MECTCGKGIRDTACQECPEYGISCQCCFVTSHRYCRWHWAHVWNVDGEFFEKRDISALKGDGNILHLNHKGAECPHPSGHKEHIFNIVHYNGIHVTKLRFCDCFDRPRKIAQLMAAKLFPATARDPKTAFTFTYMRRYHLESVQGKLSAYEYCITTQRMTNNVFTDTVPVSLTVADIHSLTIL